MVAKRSVAAVSVLVANNMNTVLAMFVILETVVAMDFLLWI